MVPRSTPQVALLLFHRAIGHAYSEVTALGWQGWLTEGEIRRIENDAIAMIRDSESLADTLPDCDPGPAIDDATQLAQQFFATVSNGRARQPVSNQ
ncbi:MAG: hypothetical protein GY789_00730 [Hyphomicrobiales bacterium]|nr:hypothetical protein [Hyphomicrobiales bacterium]MCP5001933.1 hypothetical protein [Hyphomicrobiales bacterium]